MGTIYNSRISHEKSLQLKKKYISYTRNPSISGYILYRIAKSLVKETNSLLNYFSSAATTTKEFLFISRSDVECLVVHWSDVDQFLGVLGFN